MNASSRVLKIDPFASVLHSIRVYFGLSSGCKILAGSQSISMFCQRAFFAAPVQSTVRFLRPALHNDRSYNAAAAKSRQLDQMCCTVIPKIWNKEVPSHLKALQETSFNNAYKEHFLQKYRSFACNDPNCFACNRSISV